MKGFRAAPRVINSYSQSSGISKEKVQLSEKIAERA